MNFWSEEKKAEAARLWNDGKSAGEIGALLGCSRSAVIGIAHRNRDLFPSRPRVERQARLPRHEPMARPVKPARSNVPVITWPAEAPVELVAQSEEDLAANPFEPSNPVTILDLTNTTCRWPLWPMGDNPGAQGLYCGEETAKDSAWCQHHRMRARAA